MIKVFYGEDRIRAQQAIRQFLGNDYEVIEGADLTLSDLPSVFLGASLFAATRHILIRDFSANKPAYEQLPKYLNTPHEIAVFESKLDKRSIVYKALKGKIEFNEFKLPKDPNFGLVFDIYRTAKHNGSKAVQMLEQIKPTQEPIMFFGLLVSQALKDFSARQGIKEKKVLKELSNLDLQLKTTSTEPWLLIESFLLRLA